MTSIPLPNQINVVNVGKNHDQIIIEPCWPGYGTTLANALRRALLSSLPGGAVTAVKVTGVSHEFSSLPGVKEDLVDIILNLKRLRLKVLSAEPVKIVLQVSGEKEVRAADIKTTSDVEIINKDLHIATLTDKKATLDMELVVQQGRGYVPVESRENEKVELGQIAVDAIYTPIIRVGFHVEDVRVGQVTNFDKIILDIETDGTITPLEAVKQASQILVDHFNFMTEQQVDSMTTKEELVESVMTDVEQRPVKKRGRPKKEVSSVS